MPPGITDVINSVNELSTDLMKDAYLPMVREVAFKRKRSWLADRIPRNGEGVDGLSVKISFVTRLPWSWRGMTEFGYTPTGSKFATEGMTASLGCHAAAAILSLHALQAVKGPMVDAAWKDLIEQQMKALTKTFPYYTRALLWTSQNAKKALGKAVSVAGTTITLDNVGLWNTATTDRAKLFEAGMFVQTYRGTAKVGSPVMITAVDKELGKITLESDPGVADNDVFVCSDIAGLDTPYTDLFPGILDVIDDDNTFQGVDRSQAANAMFRAVVESASGVTFGYDLLSDFFHKCYNPAQAFANYKLVREYWKDNVQENVRYAPGGNVPDGYKGLSIQVDQTTLLEDDDVDMDKVIVPDFENMRIAEAGVRNLFDMGWQQVPGRPFLEYVVAYWGLLLAEDTRYMGLLHTITL